MKLYQSIVQTGARLWSWSILDENDKIIGLGGSAESYRGAQRKAKEYKKSLLKKEGKK